MKTAAEIAEHILQRLGHIYRRPLMYGGAAQGVDQLLHVYHELWAVIVGKEQEYDRIRREVHTQHGCGAASFSIHFQQFQPEAPEGAATEYVLLRWREITERLAVPIPWAKIEQELRHHQNNPASLGPWTTDEKAR